MRGFYAAKGAGLAVFGGLVGFCMGMGHDVYHHRTPTGAIQGTAEGILIGSLLGFRVPEPLLISSEERGLHLYIQNIGITFETLKDSLCTDYLKEVKAQP